MNWKFLVGASIIVGGALAPFAPMPAIVAGIGFAVLLNWLKLRNAARKPQ